MTHATRPAPTTLDHEPDCLDPDGPWKFALIRHLRHRGYGAEARCRIAHHATLRGSVQCCADLAPADVDAVEAIVPESGWGPEHEEETWELGPEDPR